MPVIRADVTRAIAFQADQHADSRAGNDLLAVIALLLLEIRDHLRWDDEPVMTNEEFDAALQRGDKIKKVYADAGLRTAVRDIGRMELDAADPAPNRGGEGESR